MEPVSARLARRFPELIDLDKLDRFVRRNRIQALIMFLWHAGMMITEGKCVKTSSLTN